MPNYQQHQTKEGTPEQPGRKGWDKQLIVTDDSNQILADFTGGQKLRFPQDLWGLPDDVQAEIVEFAFQKIIEFKLR